MRRGANFSTGKNYLLLGDYDVFGPTPKIDDRRYGGFNYGNGLNVLLSTTPVATPASYTILDSFFGSYTNGSVTYTWARGTNW